MLKVFLRIVNNDMNAIFRTLVLVSNPIFKVVFIKEPDEIFEEKRMNKAGYTATPVACGWAGAIIEVNGAFGQEQ